MDGIRTVAVVVSILGHNFAISDADFCPPCFLCLPFCVRKDNELSKVDVYLHSASLQFCSKRCHVLDVGDNRLPSIGKFPAMLMNCYLMFVASGLSSPSMI